MCRPASFSKGAFEVFGERAQFWTALIYSDNAQIQDARRLLFYAKPADLRLLSPKQFEALQESLRERYPDIDSVQQDYHLARFLGVRRTIRRREDAKYINIRVPDPNSLPIAKELIRTKLFSGAIPPGKKLWRDERMRETSYYLRKDVVPLTDWTRNRLAALKAVYPNLGSATKDRMGSVACKLVELPISARVDQFRKKLIELGVFETTRLPSGFAPNGSWVDPHLKRDVVGISFLSNRRQWVGENFPSILSVDRSEALLARVIQTENTVTSLRRALVAQGFASPYPKEGYDVFARTRGLDPFLNHQIVGSKAVLENVLSWISNNRKRLSEPAVCQRIARTVNRFARTPDERISKRWAPKKIARALEKLVALYEAAGS